MSSIGPGIVALIGIGTDDTMDEVVPLANKILSLKVSQCCEIDELLASATSTRVY